MAFHRNLIFISGLLLGFTLAAYPVNATGDRIVLFTFGDSSYDVGNKKLFSSEFDPAATWPYGESVDDPSGRWSDGRVVPDFIGQLIGLSKPVRPVLDPKADLSHGASFAIAGATVLGHPAETMSFSQQVSKFIELKEKWTGHQRAEALYMFHIGADDYLNFAKNHPHANRFEQIAFVSQVITEIWTAITTLYWQGGARKLALQNLPPLGCLPIVRQDFKTGDKCLEMLNFMVSQHNNNLRWLLLPLPSTLWGLRYSLFDFHDETLLRINQPSYYGYTETKRSCCGIGPQNAFGCGYSNVRSNLCSYQRFFLFYDGRHNTERTNEAMANIFFFGGRNVVSPVNIRDLLGRGVANLPVHDKLDTENLARVA